MPKKTFGCAAAAAAPCASPSLYEHAGSRRSVCPGCRADPQDCCPDCRWSSCLPSVLPYVHGALWLGTAALTRVECLTCGFVVQSKYRTLLETTQAKVGKRKTPSKVDRCLSETSNRCVV